MSTARTRMVFALAPVLALGAAWACGDPLVGAPAESTDGGDGGSPTSDAPADTTVALDGGVDGDAPSDGSYVPTPIGTHPPRCPPSAGPAVAPNLADVRELYAPAAPGTEFPFQVATDSLYVYWTAMSFESAGDAPYDGLGTAKIMRVDRNGVAAGSVGSVLAQGQRYAVALAIAGDYLYWGAMNGALAEVRRVKRDCPASCPVEPVVTIGGERIVDMVEIDQKTLLVADASGMVYAVDVTTIPADLRGSQSTSPFPHVTATSTAGIAAGSMTIEVSAFALPGLGAKNLGVVPGAADASAGLSPITTDCKGVYGWRGKSEMWRLPVDGGAAVKVASPSMDMAFDLGADDAWIYIAAPNAGGVFAMGVTNGVTQTVASGNIHRLAVDSAGVYWGDHAHTTGGAISMMVK